MKKTSQKTTKKPTRTQPDAADRVAAHAAQIATNFLDADVFDFGAIVDRTDDDSLGVLVHRIDPTLRKRRAAVLKQLQGALSINKWALIEEYDAFTIEQLDAERQAAYLIGLSIGMKIAAVTR